MARQWVYWATVYHRNFLQTGTANVELFIDPPAGLMAECALSAYQDGGGGARIISVNNTYGLADDYYFGDGVWRIEMRLKIVGGLDQSNINLTRARMVVREYDTGSGWRIEPASFMRAVVYDKSSGDILHTEDVAGPADRLADLRDGKLEARAYDFVKKGKAHGRAFEVMPVDAMQSVAEGKTLQIDPIARRVVEAAPKLVQVVSLNTPPVKKVKPGKLTR